jgi:class 3 adenylate cyclase
MPLYMDIHELHGETKEEIARAHELDMETQEKYGVNYHRYWMNEKAGKLFCLCEAPNAEAAIRVHREAHGKVAEKVIEVEPDLLEGFLGGVETDRLGAALVPGVGAGGRDPGIRSVLFTDIVESTSFTQQMGDEVAMELLSVHDKIVRNALGAFGGREVKHTGDGIMASFVSAVSAVKCASRIQSDLTTCDEGPCRLKVRIGVAAGEPVEHHDDLFGATVQLAARLCSHAQPEQIIVSNVIAELCTGKILPFQELGEITLKGFGKPVRAHAVAWADQAAQPSA